MMNFQMDIWIYSELGSVAYSAVGFQSSGQATDGQIFCQSKWVQLFLQMKKQCQLCVAVDLVMRFDGQG